MNAEGGVKRSQHRDGIPDPPGDEIGLQRSILAPVARLGVHRDSTSYVQHGNDLHTGPEASQAYMSVHPAIVGWDIGGVNLKAARFCSDPGSPPPRALCQPFEVQHALESLSSTVAGMAKRLDASPDDLHAVTMTAELSQAFRSKREGVEFV